MLPTSRRRWLAMLPFLAVVSTNGWPRVVQAHHGFLGKYDFARPMYLSGRIERIDAALPHVRMTLDVPRGGGRPPRDREWMRPLEDAEARPTLTILSPFKRTGPVEITFDWRISRMLLADPSLLAEGDSCEVVVYVRSVNDEYHGELLVVLLRTPDDEVLVSSRPPSGAGRSSAVPAR